MTSCERFLEDATASPPFLCWFSSREMALDCLERLVLQYPDMAWTLDRTALGWYEVAGG